jgi:hypothetical protein
MAKALLPGEARVNGSDLGDEGVEALATALLVSPLLANCQSPVGMCCRRPVYSARGIAAR